MAKKKLEVTITPKRTNDQDSNFETLSAGLFLHLVGSPLASYNKVEVHTHTLFLVQLPVKVPCARFEAHPDRRSKKSSTLKNLLVLLFSPTSSLAKMVSAKKSRSSTSGTSAAATPTKTSSDTLIDSHVSSNQAQKAFSALAAHISKRKADSESNSNVKKVLPLDSDNPSNETIYLQLTVKKLNPSKMIKPIRIPLEHSLQTSDVSVCLLVKDPQREYKDLLTTLNIKLVERVVGVSKLKGKFKAFDARRGLMNDHQLFLADDRIVPLLPKLLGKKFFDAKK